jgi:hypothetical protein
MPRCLHVLLPLMLPALQLHPAATAPNVLFIMSDDVGWGDHSYNCDNSSCPRTAPDSSADGDAAGAVARGESNHLH